MYEGRAVSGFSEYSLVIRKSTSHRRKFAVAEKKTLGSPGARMGPESPAENRMDSW
jgi:hypothetical protein